jgi:hypothetical protein
LYEFKLYALNVASLNCVEPFYNLCLQRAMNGKVVATASYFGYYLPRPFDPLPVQFVNVEAVCGGGKITCKWSTAIESANALNFEIQRSTDGLKFETAGIVPCTGNTNTLREYSFNDKTATGKIYYRIKQNDKDGKFIYSFVVLAQCTDVKKDFYTILPNPSRDKFTISYVNIQNKKFSILVFDETGREVTAYNSMMPNGVVTILGDKPPGVYIAKISFNDGIEFNTERLVKLQ